MNYKTNISQPFLMYPRLPDGREVPKWVDHHLILEMETHGQNIKPSVTPRWIPEMDLPTLEVMVKAEFELLPESERNLL